MKTCPACLTTYDDDASFCLKDGSPLEAQKQATGDTLLGRTIAQRYHVLDKLGEGGFGTVYRVRDTRLDDIEALKVLDSRRLPADRAEEVWERFVREAKVLRQLGKRSNHVVGATNLVHDEEEDLFCYAMEYVAGKNLAQILEEEGALDPLRTVRLLRQLCKALRVAHGESIVHRDLKLENLMVTAEEEGELLRVLDFGIAKVLIQGSLTDLSVGVPGTPGYTAPEQLENPKDVGLHSDLFPVGVIFFALLTACDPWTGRSVLQPSEDSWTLVRATMTAEPKPLRELRSDLPKEFGEVISKLLQKDPKNRYESATELDEALAQLEKRLVRGRPGLGSVNLKRVAVVASIAAVAMLALLAWPLLKPAPALSFEEFQSHLDATEVLYVEARGAGLDVGISAVARSGDFRVSMEGRSLQSLMGEIETAGVPIRSSGPGSVLAEAVERGSGAAVVAPVLTLTSDEMEGCAPCASGEDLSLVSGWYELRPGSQGWLLDSIEVLVDGGYQPERMAVAAGSRIFLPGRAEVTLRATVSLSPAARARAEAQSGSALGA